MKIKFNIVRSYDIDDRDKLDKSIYFMHVPKSGGTTIDHIFAKLSSVVKNFDFHRFKHNDFSDKTLTSLNSKFEKPKFISGHLNYDFCKNIKDCFRCTIVREPIERIISNYKFFIHLQKKTPEEAPFEKYIESEVSAYRDNLITRQFSGLYGEKKIIVIKNLEDAIKNIDYFDIINTSNNWDNFLSDIITRFRFPSVIYSRFQQHDYNFNYTPNKHHLDLIRKYFFLDMELFSKIKLNNNSKNLIKKDTYNNKYLIVSPYIKSENKLYSSEEISKLFK